MSELITQLETALTKHYRDVAFQSIMITPYRENEYSAIITWLDGPSKEHMAAFLKNLTYIEAIRENKLKINLVRYYTKEALNEIVQDILDNLITKGFKQSRFGDWFAAKFNKHPYLKAKRFNYSFGNRNIPPLNRKCYCDCYTLTTLNLFPSIGTSASNEKDSDKIHAAIKEIEKAEATKDF